MELKLKFNSLYQLAKIYFIETGFMNVHQDLESVWRESYVNEKKPTMSELKERFRLLLYDAHPSEETLRFVSKNWKFLSTCPGAVLRQLHKTRRS